MKRDWQVQEAKADLSALIRAAEQEGPQMITRSGKDVAVVVSKTTFDRMARSEAARKGSLVEFFAAWPDLDIPERDRSDVGRDISL